MCPRAHRSCVHQAPMVHVGLAVRAYCVPQALLGQDELLAEVLIGGVARPKELCAAATVRDHVKLGLASTSEVDVGAVSAEAISDEIDRALPLAQLPL